MKPDFLVIGAGKCGTSTLCEVLGEHPDVFMCRPRETNFFSNDEIYSKGWEWYSSLFSEGEGKKAIGEGSGRYTSRDRYPRAAERIARDLPEAKLIYIVRDPLERLKSLWLQKLSQGDHVPSTFSTYIRSRPEDVRSSNYELQLEAYRSRFPDERILVLFFEDLKSDPATVFRRCFELLEVDGTYTPRRLERRKNVSVGKKVDRRLLRFARRMPMYSRLSRLLSEELKARIKGRFLETTVRKKPEWSPELRDEVLRTIRDDVWRFLEAHGKPRDFWRLA